MTAPNSAGRAKRWAFPGKRTGLATWLAVLGSMAAILVFGHWCAPAADAQGQLTLDDFDSTGVDTDLLALIQTGSTASGTWTILYRASPSVGSLVDGELGMGTANSAVGTLEWRGDTINDLRIINGSDLDLSVFFGTGGAGADLTIRVQTASSSGTGTIGYAAANQARWDMDASAQTLLNGLSSGDRLIVALTRPLQPPAQVTGVSAYAASDTSISVSWSAADRADGYTVEWGTTSGSYSDSAAATDTSYTITGLTPNTLYYLRVTATRSGAADGDPSAEVSVTARLEPPAQVTGLMAAVVSDVQIRLSWTLAVRAGGYRVQWGEVSGTYTGSAVTAALNHVVSGLQANTVYYFRVTATRPGTADGAPSVEISARTGLAPQPAQVTGVNAAGISDSEIQASWNPAQNATAYLVQWDDEATFAGAQEAEVSGTEAIIESLMADTEYHVRVRGLRANAPDGPWSAAVTATTLESLVRQRVRGFPGGPVAAQLALTAFGGLVSGYAVRKDKSPGRETKILGCMCLASLIMPAFGLGGNLFWTGGIVLLVALAAMAVVFLTRRL